MFQWGEICNSLSSLIRRGIAVSKPYSQDPREHVMAAAVAHLGSTHRPPDQ